MRVLATVLLLALASPAFAQEAEIPYPKFTVDEVAKHKVNIELITSTAAQCLETCFRKATELCRLNK